MPSLVTTRTGKLLMGVPPTVVVAAVVSVLLTSLVFAAAHYVGRYGDPVQWAARAFWFGFVFRWLAGVFFSILFVCRGFGVTAGAHAGYDILVKLL